MDKAFKKNLLILISGEKSIRFRPSLNLSKNEVDEAISILEGAIS